MSLILKEKTSISFLKEPLEENDKKSDALIEIKSKKFQLAKQKVLDWSLTCHVDCFPKIFETKNWIGKIIWIIILIAFSAGTVWIVLLCVLNFFEFEAVTKFEVINERPIEFPAVTICDSNPFTTEVAQEIFEYFLNETFGYEEFKNLTYWSANEAIKLLTDVTKLFVASYSDIDSNEFKQSLGLNLNLDNHFSILQKCYFNAKRCTLDSDKFVYDGFYWFYNFDYGNCYTFNSGLNLNGQKSDIKKVDREGQDYGLSLCLGPLLNKNTKYPTSESKGLKVFIHNQSFGPSYAEGINIDLGKETHIAISKVFTHNYPQPYSECVDLSSSKSDLYMFILSTNKTYRQKDCLDLCFQKRIISNCGCYYPKFPMVVESEPCSDVNCVKEQYLLVNETYEEECSRDCPLECDTVTYNTQISSLDYPSKEAYKLLLDAIDGINYYKYNYNIDFDNYDVYKESFLLLNIYFPSTQYTKITQSPKTVPVDLFANIGGSIGIFLGLSIFHIVEIFEIIYIVLYILIK